MFADLLRKQELAGRQVQQDLLEKLVGAENLGHSHVEEEADGQSCSNVSPGS